MGWEDIFLTKVKNKTLTQCDVQALSEWQLEAPVWGEPSLLHWVIYLGTTQMMSWVIEALGSRVSAICAKPNEHGWTPLHAVTDKEDAVALIVMLATLGSQAAAACAMPNKDGWTPLHLVADKQDAVASIIMLNALGSEAAAVCAMPNKDDWTPLHAVAEKQNTAVLTVMLAALGSQAATVCAMPTKDGWTPLHAVAEKQDTAALKVMLAALDSKAAAVCAMPTKDGWTPLHAVAEKQDTAALKVMLTALGSQAATVCTMPNKDGWTPLHAVAERQDIAALIAMLAALGSKAATACAMPNKDGWTPLHAVADKQNTTALIIMLDALGSQAAAVCAKPNKDGWTPLHLVADKQDTAALIAMLAVLDSQAADVCAMLNKDGWTPLHLVAHNKSGKLDPVALKIMLTVLGPEAKRILALKANDGSNLLLSFADKPSGMAALLVNPEPYLSTTLTLPEEVKFARQKLNTNVSRFYQMRAQYECLSKKANLSNNMMTQTFGIDPQHSGEFIIDPPTVHDISRAVDDYRKNRQNGLECDNPQTPFPQDGRCDWSHDWGMMPNPKRWWRARYDEGPRDRAWMEERDCNYLARLKKENEQLTQERQQKAAKEQELEAIKLELEQEKEQRVAKERKLEAKNLELLQERQQKAAKEQELEAIKSELEQEKEQRVAKERELEAKNSELLQEQQQRTAKEKELRDVNSELVLELAQERQERAAKEKELEAKKSELVLELAQEKQQKETKEKELEVVQLKLKTARSALLPIIPSDTVGKEELPLAQGGYGFVYRGEWLGETIALKELINPNLTDDAIKEFKEEALKMAHLRSPYVVMIYGITLNVRKRLKGIVMEYMPQGSLDRILGNRGIALRWLVRHKMALAVTRGLSCLHQQNIIHNDLKSANVLVRHHSDEWRLKLADFGLSRIKQETARFTGKPQGTPAWMAPELFEESVYSKASDVYAYGIVLWEIVSREIPFKNKTDCQIMRSVCDKKERPPIPPEAPPSLVALMGLCWKQNRAERLPTEDIITKLEALPLKQELREFDNRDNAIGKLKNQRVDKNTSPQFNM